MLMADRIVLMRKGQVIQCGTPKDLYNHPVTPFAAEFFCEVNHLKGVVKGDWIETNAGLVANNGQPEGMRVDVLVRPEAVTLGSETFGKAVSQNVRVCAVDYARGTSHIRLGLGEELETTNHILARHQGPFHSEIGDRVQLNIDQNQTFIFPQKSDP
ncbi:MAG: hypothetical protein CBC83_04375 [Flavobacteriales bacterium TMED123]|nr:MAG: hypothetical protein CBC83_04375 [Flavobacteriales bacterium TMED123]